MATNLEEGVELPSSSKISEQKIYQKGKSPRDDNEPQLPAETAIKSAPSLGPSSSMIVETARSLDGEICIILGDLAMPEDVYQSALFAYKRRLDRLPRGKLTSLIRVLTILQLYSTEESASEVRKNVGKLLSQYSSKKVSEVRRKITTSADQELLRDSVLLWEQLMWGRVDTVGSAASGPEFLRVLATLMTAPSEDGLIRASIRAVETLGRSADLTEVFNVLEGFLADSSPETVISVFKAVGRLGVNAATPKILQGLEIFLVDWKNLSVQMAALEAVQGLGEKAGTLKILEGLANVLSGTRLPALSEMTFGACRSIGERALTPGVLKGLEVQMVSSYGTGSQRKEAAKIVLKGGQGYVLKVLKGVAAMLTSSGEENEEGELEVALEAVVVGGEESLTLDILKGMFKGTMRTADREKILAAVREIRFTRALSPEALEAFKETAGSPQIGLARAAVDFLSAVGEAGLNVPVELLGEMMDQLERLGDRARLGTLINLLGPTRDHAASVAKVLALVVPRMASPMGLEVRAKACFAVQSIVSKAATPTRVTADLIELTRSFDKPMRDQVIGCYKEMNWKELSAARKTVEAVINGWAEEDEGKDGVGDGRTVSRGSVGPVALAVAGKEAAIDHLPTGGQVAETVITSSEAVVDARAEKDDGEDGSGKGDTVPRGSVGPVTLAVADEEAAMDHLPTGGQLAETDISPAETVGSLICEVGLHGKRSQWSVFPLRALCRAYEDATPEGTKEADKCLAVLVGEGTSFSDRMRAMVALSKQALEQDAAAILFQRLREVLGAELAGGEAPASIPVAAALVQLAIKYGLMEPLSTVDSLVLAWGKPSSDERYPYAMRFLTADHMAQAIGVGVENAEAYLADSPVEAGIRELPRVAPEGDWAIGEDADFELVVAVRGIGGRPNDDSVGGVAESVLAPGEGGGSRLPLLTLAGALRFFLGSHGDGNQGNSAPAQRLVPASSSNGRAVGVPAGGGGPGGGSGGGGAPGVPGTGGQGMVDLDKLKVKVEFKKSVLKMGQTPGEKASGQMSTIRCKVALEMSRDVVTGAGLVGATLVAETDPGEFVNEERECGFIQTEVKVGFGPADNTDITARLQDDSDFNLVRAEEREKINFGASATSETSAEGTCGFTKILSVLGKCGGKLGQGQDVRRDEEVVAGFKVSNQSKENRVGSRSRLLVIHRNERYARGVLISGSRRAEDRDFDGAGCAYRAQMRGSWRFVEEDSVNAQPPPTPPSQPPTNLPPAPPSSSPPSPRPASPAPNPSSAASNPAQAPLTPPVFQNFSIDVTQRLVGEAVRDTCCAGAPCIPQKWSKKPLDPKVHKATMKFKVSKDLSTLVAFPSRYRSALYGVDGAAEVDVVQLRV